MPALDLHHSYRLVRRDHYGGSEFIIVVTVVPIATFFAIIACITVCCCTHRRDKRRGRGQRLAEREAAVQRDSAAARGLQLVELRGGDTADDEAIARALAESEERRVEDGMGEVAPAYVQAPAVGNEERQEVRGEGDAPPPYKEGAGTRV